MTKDQKYKKDLDVAIKQQRDYKKLCKQLDRVYDGDYIPCTGATGSVNDYSSGKVKSHKLFESVEDYISTHMPPRGDISIPSPRNPDNMADYYASKTADSLLEYALNNGYDDIEDAVRNMRLLNYGYIRIGFRPDDVTEDDEMHDLSMPQVGDKIKGQPFIQSVHPKNIVKAPGYKTIREAWSEGGYVARKFWGHIDWVKSRDAFKGTRYLNADVMYKGQESDKFNKDKVKENELQYCTLWEVFYGPTKKHPDGLYIIRSQIRNQTLYEHKGKIFKGLNIPIIEFMDHSPRSTQYATPISARALNPMFEMEYYDTDVYKKIDQSLDIIVESIGTGDELETILEDASREFKNVVTLSSDEIGEQVKDAVQHLQINLDTRPSQMASQKAQSRFEEMMGLSLTQPRLEGGEIATEMAIKNRGHLQRVNKARDDIRQNVANCLRGWLDVAKELMSHDEMVRITRNVNRVWKDDDIVTLEGDYAVQINAEDIIDMSEGERMKSIQMILTVVANAIATSPQLARELDIAPILKEALSIVNIPTGEVFVDANSVGQWTEIAQAYAGFPIEVEPDDNDSEHLRVLKMFFAMLDKYNGEISGKTNDALIQHAEEHVNNFNTESQGSMNLNTITGGGQQGNLTNINRSAGAETMGEGYAGAQAMGQGGV